MHEVRHDIFYPRVLEQVLDIQTLMDVSEWRALEQPEGNGRRNATMTEFTAHDKNLKGSVEDLHTYGSDATHPKRPFRSKGVHGHGQRKSEELAREKSPRMVEGDSHRQNASNPRK